MNCRNPPRSSNNRDQSDEQAHACKANRNIRAFGHGRGRQGDILQLLDCLLQQLRLLGFKRFKVLKPFDDGLELFPVVVDGNCRKRFPRIIRFFEKTSCRIKQRRQSRENRSPRNSCHVIPFVAPSWACHGTYSKSRRPRWPARRSGIGLNEQLARLRVCVQHAAGLEPTASHRAPHGLVTVWWVGHGYEAVPSPPRGKR